MSKGKPLGWLHPNADGNTKRDKAALPDRSQLNDLGPSDEVQPPRYECGMTGGDCPVGGNADCPSC